MIQCALREEWDLPYKVLHQHLPGVAMIVMLAIVAVVDTLVQCMAIDIVVAIPTAAIAVAMRPPDNATDLQARHVVPEDRHRHPHQSLGQHLQAHQLWRIIPGALT